MLLAEFAMVASASFAQAAIAEQQVPAAASREAAANTPQQEPTQIQDVVVLGARPDVISEIDRKIYTVARDSVAQSMPALEILGRLPSVTISPSGNVRLLGQSNVNILVDGERPANAQALLRTLNGSGIERIEVVTNPSAQFAAEGTGGVINIITRRPTIEGYSGTFVAAVDTLGGGQITYSPNMKIGRWTFAAAAGVNREVSQYRGGRFREASSTPLGPVYDLTSRTNAGVDNAGGSLRMNYAYALSANERVSGAFDFASSEGHRHSLTEYLSLALPADSHLEQSSEPIWFDGGSFTAGYARTGPRDGEVVTATLNLSGSALGTENTITSDYGSRPPDQFRTHSFGENDGGSLKVEYKRPLSSSHLVTLGASWERQRERIQQGLTLVSGANLGLAEFASEVEGTRDIAAAYMTIQFPWEKFTLMPGLRLEAEAYDFNGSSGFSRRQPVEFFPSFHLSRPLSERLGYTLSYSKRTSRPDASSLDPTLVLLRERQARRGNPQLLPQTTHSFEAGLDYTSPEHSFSIKIYDKETSDLWAQAFNLDGAGVLISTRINAGDAWDRGLDVSLRGRLADHFRYQASGNIYRASRILLSTDDLGKQVSVAYSFSGRLEYIENPGAPARGHQIQLSLNYLGPQRLLQSEVDAYLRASLTWRRPLTTDVAAVLTIQNLLDGEGARMRTIGQDFTEQQRDEGEGVQARLTLTYRFGG